MNLEKKKFWLQICIFVVSLIVYAVSIFSYIQNTYATNKYVDAKHDANKAAFEGLSGQIKQLDGKVDRLLEKL